MPPLRPSRHVFVCQNERPAGGRPACAGRGSPALAEALLREISARPELWGEVAITPSGCLGPCFEGPVVVVYPEGVWYLGAQASDARELVDEHLVKGNIVRRLCSDDSTED